jgi:4'-phosphopantetheinyl transferase
MSLDSIKSLKLSFYTGKNEKKCVLSIARPSYFRSDNTWEGLSPDELKKIDSIGLEKRKKQYYCGRMTTKKALSFFTNELIFRDVSVINEASGCPVIQNSRYATSITHTHEIVASIVFKKEFSFGIDVENVRKNAVGALRSVITTDDHVPDNLSCLTVAWTLKEALAKALKCGFRLPREELELTLLPQSANIFSCAYTKHPEFQGRARIYHNKSCAIAYPTDIDLAPKSDLFL